MPAPLFCIRVQDPKSLSSSDFCEYSQRVMSEPPSPFELQVNATDALPAVADGVPGAGGFSAWGVTAVDASDSSPSPTLFTARTLNWYAVPFVRPVTV